MDNLEAELKALREQMAKVMERREMPRLFKYAEAARLLSISLSKLKGLIRSGVVVPTTLGETKMIALSEIERVATPKLPKKIAATVPKKHDGAAAAAAFRASLKKSA